MSVHISNSDHYCLILMYHWPVHKKVLEEAECGRRSAGAHVRSRDFGFEWRNYALVTGQRGNQTDNRCHLGGAFRPVGFSISGGYVFWRVSLKVLSLQSNPFVVVLCDLPVPLDEASEGKATRLAVKYGTPIGPDFPGYSLYSCWLYCDMWRAYGGEIRCGSERVICPIFCINSPIKSRNTLKRKSEQSLEQTNTRSFTIGEFRSFSEIRTFREIAIGISHRSYKRELGWGFREEQSFARQLETDADAGVVRGYVLSIGDQPAAYVFCRIDHDVIIYKHLGYDERFTQYSPGTVLGVLAAGAPVRGSRITAT